MSVECCTAYQVEGDAQALQESESQCQYGFAAALVRAATAAARPEGKQGSEGPLQQHKEVHHLAGDSVVPAGRRRLTYAGTSRRREHPPCTEGAQGEDRRLGGEGTFFYLHLMRREGRHVKVLTCSPTCRREPPPPPLLLLLLLLPRMSNNTRAWALWCPCRWPRRSAVTSLRVPLHSLPTLAALRRPLVSL